MKKSIGFLIPRLATEDAIPKTIVNRKENDNEWEIGAVQRLRGSYIEVKQGLVAFLVIVLSTH